MSNPAKTSGAQPRLAEPARQLVKLRGKTNGCDFKPLNFEVSWYAVLWWQWVTVPHVYFEALKTFKKEWSWHYISCPEIENMYVRDPPGPNPGLVFFFFLLSFKQPHSTKRITAQKRPLPSANYSSYWMSSVAYNLVENILVFFIAFPMNWILGKSYLVWLISEGFYYPANIHHPFGQNFQSHFRSHPSL